MFFFQFLVSDDPAERLAMMRADPALPLPLVAVPSGDASTANAVAAHLGRLGGGACYLGLDERWEPTGLEGFGEQLMALARAVGPGRRIVLEASHDPEDAWVAFSVEHRPASVVTAGKPAPLLASESPAAPYGHRDASREPVPDLIDLGPQPFDESVLRGLGEHTPAGLQRAGVIDVSGRPTIAGAVIALADDQDAINIPALCVQVERFGHPLTQHEEGTRPVESRLVTPPMARAILMIADLATLAAPALSERGNDARAVLTELLVNAIAHRTYEPEQVEKFSHVQIFSDAIRLSNPGEASPAIRGKARYLPSPAPPNPNLMSKFARLGLARGQGLGLATARALARGAGMGVTIEAAKGWVHATLHFDPAVDDEPSPTPELPLRSRRLRMPAYERYQNILDQLQQLGVASSRELADELGWPTPTVRAALKEMQEQGSVMQTDPNPRSPRQRYRLTDPSATDK